MVISLCCFSFFCCSPSSSSSSFSSPRAYLPTNTAPQPKTPPFRHQTKQTNPKKKKLPTLMHQTTSTATTQSPYDLHNPQKIPKTGQKHKRTPQQKAAAAATILWRWRGSQKGDRRARCLLACWLATEWIFQVNQDRSIFNLSVPIRSHSLLDCWLTTEYIFRVNRDHSIDSSVPIRLKLAVCDACWLTGWVQSVFSR